MFRDGKYYCEYCGKEIVNRCLRDLKQSKHHFCNKNHYQLNMLNRVEYKDDFVIIFVNYKDKEYECLVDVDDYKNKIKPLGLKICIYERGYCFFNQHKKKIKLHRYLMDVVDDNSVMIDHINRNPLDNRKCNLRKANYILNRFNSSLSKHNTSNVKGVTWLNRIKKWRGEVCINGIRKFTIPNKDFQICIEETKKLRESMYKKYIETLDENLKNMW